MFNCLFKVFLNFQYIDCKWHWIASLSEVPLRYYSLTPNLENYMNNPIVNKPGEGSNTG